MRKNLFSITSLLSALFLLLIFSTNGNAQVLQSGSFAEETVFNAEAQINFTPFQVDFTQPISNFEPDGTQALLYDNGSVFNIAGPPQLSELQTALGMNSYGPNASNTAGYTVADDFTLTNDADITSIDFYSYQTGSGNVTTINGVFVQIYNGKPGAGGTVIWGNMSTNILGSAGQTGGFRVLDTAHGNTDRPIQKVTANTTGLSLTAGTYWVEYAFSGTTSSGPWAPPITITGQTTTGNAIQWTGSAYADITDIGQQGLPFQIYGDETGGGGPFPDPYCDVDFPSAVEPISRVIFNTIDNSSDPAINGSPALEDFTAVTTSINAGEAYPVAVEGNTNGAFTTYVTVYIDYDQSGTFEESERTDIGTIYNSTGTDGIQATGTINIPADAVEGPTRMRVLKKWGGYVTDACNTTGYGQAEDYTINVNGGGGGPFPDPYCEVTEISFVEPITRVVIADIDNSSSPSTSSPSHEDFTSVVGHVEQGETYPIAVEGYTGGNWTNSIRVYIDWNQDGDFTDPGEYYLVGDITNSTGTDGIQAIADIAVPSDALEGNTRMRVIKKFLSGDPSPNDGCTVGSSFGQAEDYTINVSGSGGGTGCLWTVHVWEDYFGDEVEWELRDSGGTVLISGGNYGLDYDDTQTVTNEGPVTFWITNDGLFGDNEPNYEVSNENGILVSGTMPLGGDTRTFDDLKCSDGGGGTGGECDYELFTTSAGDPGNFFNSFAGVTFDMQNSGTDDLTITGFKVPVTDGSSLDVDIYYTTTAGSNVGVQSDPSAWTLLDSLTGIPAIEAVAWDVNTFTQVSLTNTLTLAPGESKGFYILVTNYSTGISYHYTNGNFTATDGYLTILSNGFGSTDVPFSNSFADRAFVGEVQYSGECTEPPTGDCPIEYAGDFNDGLGNLATGIILAADFPVPSGETWNLGDVKVQLLYETSSVEISFYQDAGGQPGTQIFAPTVVTPSNQEIIGDASGTDIYEVTLDMSSYNISLTGGMYWMGITTTAPGGESYWHYTDTVNNGTNFFGSLDGYATWEDLATYGFSVDGAFSICTGTTPPPTGDCEQDFYTTEDPISGAGFSSGNWVANDVIVAGGTQFMMQTMTFEAVALSGNPTNFDLEIFEDNGSGGVGDSTGMTYHFDSSNMTYTPNGMLFGAYPQYTVVFDLPDILLQANGSSDTRYWLAVTSDLSSTGDFTYWVSYLHTFTPIPDSNPTWQYLASDGVWAQYDSSGPNEGYMKVEGQCSTLGTADLTSFDFAYYPNPVKDVLNITSQKAVKTVEAFNMTGQKVLSSNKVTNGQIDVNALTPGVYVFKAVLEGGQVETFKIIKK